MIRIVPDEPSETSSLREHLNRSWRDLPGPMRVGIAAWAALGGFLLAGAVLWLAAQVRAIFPPLVLALAIIYLLNPVVSRLEKRGVSRVIGTLAIYMVFISLLVVAGLLVTPPLVGQVAELTEDLPRLVTRVSDGIESLAAGVGITFDEELIDNLSKDFQNQLSSGASQVLAVTAGVVHLVLIIVLAPIVALYLLIDLPKIQRSFHAHLPPRYKEEWLDLLDRSGQAVGSFFRGQLLVALIVGFMTATGLAIIGLPFWLPIGLLAGFFNIIPMIGPFVGGGFAVIVGMATGGVTQALFAALVMVIVQQIDNHLISPNVMGRAVRLHPVTIILALLAGATISGLWGMLLSVPAAAVGKIVLLHYYSKHVLEEQRLDPVHPAEHARGAVVVPEKAGESGTID